MYNWLQSSHNASGLSLHELITSAASNSRCEVMAIELKKTAASSLGFMLGVDTDDLPVVKHVQPDIVVVKGDRHVSCC